MNPRDLPSEWRTQAEQQRTLGAEAQACTLEWCSRELEAAWMSHELEELTVAQAAEESGYSEEHLRRLIRQGSISNVGSPNAPRIPRCDLPRKPGHPGDVLGIREVVHCKEQIARSVAESWEGGSDG